MRLLNRREVANNRRRVRNGESSSIRAIRSLAFATVESFSKASNIDRSLSQRIVLDADTIDRNCNRPFLNVMFNAVKQFHAVNDVFSQ